jgi:hypothetical protein
MKKDRKVTLSVRVTFVAKTATANAKNIEALLKLLEKRARAFKLRAVR